MLATSTIAAFTSSVSPSAVMRYSVEGGVMPVRRPAYR
jgi:hypothetical protein